MRLMHLLKKIFVPSYTDKRVEQINAENERRIKEAINELEAHRKVLVKSDVAFSIYIATGGKHGQ